MIMSKYILCLQISQVFVFVNGDEAERIHVRPLYVLFAPIPLCWQRSEGFCQFFETVMAVPTFLGTERDSDNNENIPAQALKKNMSSVELYFKHIICETGLTPFFMLNKNTSFQQ